MSTLSTVPEEILINILDFLRKDQKSLCSLALAARRFKNPTTSYILRSVNILIKTIQRGKKKRSWRNFAGIYLIKCLSGFSARYELLLRSITETPSLAEYIFEVAFYSICNEISSQKHNELAEELERECHAQANRLLEKLPNLQKLKVVSLYPGTNPFVPTFFQSNPVPRLREVFISQFKTTVNEVALYLARPNLQEMDAWLIEPLATFEEATQKKIEAERKPGATISVLRLAALDNARLMPSELYKLLSIPSSVKTLYCPIPGREQDTQSPRPTPRSMAEPLSPSSIKYALSPLRDNLTTLLLRDSAEWPGHDLSRMDLSGFSALQKLSAPSSCFFPSSSPHEPRRGVWKLLPHGLQKLEVSLMTKKCSFFYCFTDDF